MLDTVRFNFDIHSPLRPRMLLHHPVIRFKRTPLGDGLASLECSLPRLLWGHNGRVIANQAELDAGFAALWDEADKVAIIPALSDWTPRRLDLVWQFEGLNAGVVDALSGFNYPSVRNPPLHQAGRGVTWKGAGSRFVVTAYDKPRKMRVEGDVLRIEVRLCGNELCRLRGRDWQKFGNLWATYREIILRLPGVPRPKQSIGWPEAIGRFVPKEHQEIILSSFDKEARTVRQYRQRMRIAAADLPDEICWAKILPPELPPQPFNIERPKRQPRGGARHGNRQSPTP